MNEFTQANKNGWDGLAETHYKNYHVDKLISGTPLINDVIRSEVGDVTGRSLCHLLCHIGTDTLSWALLGAKVTGIDISPESLKYARKIAKDMHIDATFIESDVMDVINKVDEKFDIVFSSTGVLCWLPDIQRYAQTVKHLLKDGGIFYLFDGHPFRSVMLDDMGEYEALQRNPCGEFSSDENSRPKRVYVSNDYFRKQVWHYNELGDYTDPDLAIPSDSYEWHWTMGEIITAFCEAGMRIEFLHEFPQYFYSGYTPYDVADESENKVELFPCTFSLKARAEVIRV